MASEKNAILKDTASGIRAVQMENLKDTMEAVQPANKNALLKRVNPFTHRDRMDSWERVKVLLGVIVVPLRVLLFTLFLLLSIVFLELSILGLSKESLKTTPLSGCRRFSQRIVNVVFIRAVLFFMGIAWLRVKGRPSKDARCVVVAPHSTWVDGFIMAYLMEVGSPVAKVEAAKGNCLMSALFTTSQAILVDRKSSEGRSGALRAISDRLSSALNWRHVYLFPEGTCTNRKCLINFKVGAFVSGNPVQPVLLRWNRNVNFDPVWTSGGPNRVWLIYRFLSQLFVAVDVEFLPVYYPQVAEKENATVYAQSVRKIMADKLGVPITDHSYEDSFLATLAHKRKLNPESSMPYEFSKLNKLHDVKYDETSRLMKRFAEVKTKKKQYQATTHIDDSDGLTLEEFAELLGLPLTDPVIDFFSYLDVTGEGVVNFPAFLIGLSFLSQNSNVEECAQLVWSAMDQDKDGRVPVKELKRELDLVFQRTGKGTIPLLKESKGGSTISFDEFVKMLKLHPEYLPVALQFVGEGDQRPVSIATAKARLHEKQSARDNALEMDSVEDPGSPEQSGMKKGGMVQMEVGLHQGEDMV